MRVVGSPIIPRTPPVGSIEWHVFPAVSGAGHTSKRRTGVSNRRGYSATRAVASVLGGCVIAGALGLAGRASAAPIAITTERADFEARLASNTGSYAIGPSNTATSLRVGFADNFGVHAAGTTGADGGMTAVWYFKLPQVNLAAGDLINSAHFGVYMLEEANRSNDITPRFNADLWALGVVRSLPTSATYTDVSQSYFYLGDANDTRAGEGGFSRTRIQNDYFVPYTDYSSVNPGDPIDPATPKEFGTKSDGDANLLAYVLGVYQSPTFQNDGQNYLVLRMNPDRGVNEKGFDNADVANGRARYTMASAESTLSGTAVPPTLTLDVTSVPEPGTLAVLALGGVGLLGRRRRWGER
jgi:hypothetical protein